MTDVLDIVTVAARTPVGLIAETSAAAVVRRHHGARRVALHVEDGGARDGCT